MNLVPQKYRKRLEQARTLVVDDQQRRELILKAFNMLLCLVAGGMTVVNVFTQKWLLFASTLAFTIACLINSLLLHQGYTGKNACLILFLAESLLLCGFFCISGTPEGFSALWTCFIPSFSFTLLGVRKGSIYSGLGFLMIVLIFWTPFGRSILQYPYTASFMLRFPMIYLAFTVLAVFLETIRAETQRQLLDSEKRYHNLYRRDALTGILNRYGFNEQFDQLFASPSAQTLSLLMLDLDNFKRVNDEYGHDTGDVVLRFVADTMSRVSGPSAVVCRWGGEEFTSLIPNVSNPEALAERIRREVEESTITAGDKKIQITVTIGVCTVKERRGISIADMVRAADQKLYQAKDAGRNRVGSTTL